MNSSEIWTVIGAMGSWAGAIMSLLAMVIAIKAYIQPMRVKVKGSISQGVAASGAVMKPLLIITVVNNGVRSATINSITLATKKRKYIIPLADRTILLHSENIGFPVKLEPGAVIRMTLDKYRLKQYMASILEETKEDHSSKMWICVDISEYKDIRIETHMKLKDLAE